MRQPEKTPIVATLTCGLPIFAESPKKGHIHVFRDQIFTCLRIEGSSIAWAAHCAKCGEAFTVIAPHRSQALTRRCKAHAVSSQRIGKDVHPAAQGKAPTPKQMARKAPTPAKLEERQTLDQNIDKAYGAWLRSPEGLEARRVFMDAPSPRPENWSVLSTRLYRESAESFD